MSKEVGLVIYNFDAYTFSLSADDLNGVKLAADPFIRCCRKGE